MKNNSIILASFSIIIIAFIYLSFHVNSSPNVGDWCCILFLEFGCQMLYSNLKDIKLPRFKDKEYPF